MKEKRYRRYKNILEKFLDSSNGKRIFNIIYSVGAAVVILGAMFKLLHLPSGNLMLMIGMITEAFVFLLSAFERPEKEYKWEEVYPVLADNDEFIPKSERINKTAQTDNRTIRPNSTQTSNSNVRTGTTSSSYNNSSTTNNLRSNTDHSQNNNNQSTNRGSNVTIQTASSQSPNTQASINNTYSQKSDIPHYSSNGAIIGGGSVVIDSTNMTDASEKYANQLTKMSENMEKFAKVTQSLSTISDTLLSSFQTIIDNSNGIGTNTQGYITQMETLNRNIAGLNTIYEIQLKGVSGQINTIEEINAGLDRIKKLYSGSLADSSIFKNETEKMAKQLTELNAVYARLLQAMTANMNINNSGFNPNNTNNTQL